ncbi:hypothetical protein NP493_15g06052 [Ridgeia piscesae]|uniref:Exonuclease domain-containing protein n=1 Tax=Ridgeia piscesae TaxID=27915 RepID=A0AAD9PEJ7_RIDPI|nr:hypothetical protein NP493_15g06052 [Ridgeia piscesae]
MFCVATSHNGLLRNSVVPLVRAVVIPHRFYRQSAISVKLSANKMTSENARQPTQLFDYFLVLDFEATCDQDKKPQPQEIIEFPVLKVNGKTFETEAVFHQYVQPRVNRELSPFCTELTGIIQDMVDNQPHLEETLQKFANWMETEGLWKDDVKSVFVTCGDWDLKTMLPQQCKYFNIRCPQYFKTWINIKKSYCDHQGNYARGMMPMLSGLGLRHEGRHHSGIGEHMRICRYIYIYIIYIYYIT